MPTLSDNIINAKCVFFVKNKFNWPVYPNCGGDQKTLARRSGQRQEERGIQEEGTQSNRGWSRA